MLELKEVKESSQESLQIKVIYRNSSEGSSLMDQIYDLRKEVYTSLKWVIDPDKEPHMIKDLFDNIPFTTHFAVIENNRMIACNRMTKYSISYKLPIYKEGFDLSLFNTKSRFISEATRLLVKQDKPYPGCALQLLYNALDYTFKNKSKLVCSIGNPDHKDLYTYMGCVIPNKDIDCVLDKTGGEKVVRKGTPLLVHEKTLNRNLNLKKYKFKREFVVIKSG